MLDRLRRVETSIATAESRATAVLIGGAVLISLYTIIFRQAHLSTGDWVLDLPLELLAWATFLGSGALIAEKGHIKLEILFNRIPPPVAAVIEALLDLGLAVFSVALALWALRMVLQYHALGAKDFPLWNLPLWWFYSVLPVEAALWAVHFACGSIYALERALGSTESSVASSKSAGDR